LNNCESYDSRTISPPGIGNAADLFVSSEQEKKADVAVYSWVFDHAGLFTDEPPGTIGLPFI
jgi:hypothetical protein